MSETFITVRKILPDGSEAMRYSGRVLERTALSITIEAFFSRPDVPLPYVTFRRGDRLIERFYTNRWYNIFELYDVSGGHLKGWYCNIARPALIDADNILWFDLALDVWLSPAGDVLVLDEDEFAELALDEATRRAALSAVDAG
ncbi:MAG: DUF402 domain-containing protein, partial [Aggregatilineales bacterium]